MSDDEYDNDSLPSSISDSDSDTEKPFKLTPKGGKSIDINPVDIDEDEENEDEEDDEELEDEDDDDESIYKEEIEEEEKPKAKGKKNEEQKKENIDDSGEYKNEDVDSDEETDENYLQKFDVDINKNYLLNVHPECLHHNYDEIEALTVIVRDGNNVIIDPFHKTIPFLTKYERARVLGQRAKQINMGAQAFVEIPENVIDGIIVAELELKQKKIPFIIKRPLPNGACEYWNVNDLENILY